MKTALITGITGQDGSYLAEFLLKKDYKVYGMIRRTSLPNTSRIKHLLNKIELIEGDLTDQRSLDEAIILSQPDEVYNLAAQSFNETSWKEAELTGNVNGLGVLRLLEAVRKGIKILNKEIKYYQASSSQLFGKSKEIPQNEKTPFSATINPYTTAKLYAHYTTIMYRENFGMFTVNGITFNHESPRRGFEFVTRKISREVAKISLELSNELLIGNLEGKKDWGFAGDYVEAMWLALQHDVPDDYVIATGEINSVKDFIEEAFKLVGLDWKKYVKQDPRFIRRATDENISCGDATKAREQLGWKPKVNFKELVKMMVENDLKEIQKELAERK